MVDLGLARPFGSLPGSLPGPRNRRVSAFLIGLLLTGGFLLHSATLPLSHAEITLDGSLGPKGPLAGPDYVIGHDLGQVRGSNLFHSFGELNVLRGESATFTGPNTIENILGRVTGGHQSFIDGLLRSTIPGANLFLLNPSGVLFGPNAALEVDGSFHVSTADYLRMSDGGRFHADLTQPTVLTTAPIEAFGFLGPNPASISLQGSSLSVPSGQTLSLLGGEIAITGASVKAEHGRIHLASVGSAGEILRPGSGQILPGAPGQPPGLDVSSFARLGPITASDSSNIAVSSPLGAGTVVIRGGRLLLDHASINAQTLGDLDGAPVGQDIQVREEVLLTNGASLSAEPRGAGQGADLQITAGNRVQVKEDSSISTAPLGPGDGGSITVRTGRLELTDGGLITSDTRGSGHGGNLEVTAAESIQVADKGAITGRSLGAGDAGNLTVKANRIVIQGVRDSRDPFFADFTGLSTGTGGTGKAGDLGVTAESIQVTDKGVIGAGSSGAGDAGTLQIAAGSLRVTGGGLINAGSSGSGHGGNLEVRVAESIQVTDKGVIGAGSSGAGDAGTLQIAAGSLHVTGGGLINSGASGSGHGGDIEVRAAESIQVTDKGIINASSSGDRDAGNIHIDTGRLRVTGGGTIFSGAKGSGHGGDLEVTAEEVTIVGVRDSNDPFVADFTGLSVGTLGNGKGGDLRLTAESIQVTDKGNISSGSAGAGDAGNVQIDAGRLRVTDGGVILGSAFGSGDGGDIEVNAEEVTVAGAGRFLSIDPLKGGQGSSAIASAAFTGGGTAGNVRIHAGSLRVLDGAKLATRTSGPGNSGYIEVSARSVLVSGVNLSLRESLSAIPGLDPRLISATGSAGIMTDSSGLLIGDAATGHGGNVRITAGDLQVNAGGIISSETTTPGSGGAIEVVADRVTLGGNALISAESALSANGGKAGDISITARDTLQIDHSAVTTAADHAEGGAIALAANRVRLGEGAVISARSSGAGNAGNIRITARDTFQSQNSSVTTEAAQSGGGQIELNAGSRAHLRGSKITTTVQGGAGDAGNITLQGIEPEAGSAASTRAIVLNDSQVVANAFEGKGGNIRIVAGMFLADPGSRVDASSKLGIDGRVDIRAPVTQISGSLAPLSKEFLSAAALLRERCAERIGGGRLSSLVVSGRDGLPLEPGGPLPSPFYSEGETVDESSPKGARLENPSATGLNPVGFDPALQQMSGWDKKILSPEALDLGCSRWRGK